LFSTTRNPWGLPEFYSVSLSTCHGLMTPANLHILANSDASVLSSGKLKPSTSALNISKLYQHFRERDFPYGL